MMIGLMLAHWVGDFLLQSSWMALEKSRSILALSAHVGTYGLVILVWSLFVTSPLVAIQFVAVNMALHFVIDSVTSRLTTYFRHQDNQRAMFSTIGFDQWLHFVCLYVTAQKYLV